MGREEMKLRSIASKIKPSEALISSTLDAMREKSAERKRRSHATYFLRTASALCSFAVIALSIVLLKNALPYQMNGTFSSHYNYTEETYPYADAVVPRTVRQFTNFRGDSEEEQGYFSRFENYLQKSFGNNTAMLIADAEIISGKSYKTDDDFACMKSFSLLELRITKAIKQNETGLHQFKKNDVITVVIFENQYTDVPQSLSLGKSFRWLVWTGEDGIPLETTGISAELGFENVFMIYDCYPTEKN